MGEAYLDTHLENAEELYLVLRDHLGERNKDTRLEGHLAVIFHAIAKVESQKMGCLVKHITHINSSSPSTSYSIQLTTKVTILETTSVIPMNLKVSVVPHNRSR